MCATAYVCIYTYIKRSEDNSRCSSAEADKHGLQSLSLVGTGWPVMPKGLTLSAFPVLRQVYNASSGIFT